MHWRHLNEMRMKKYEKFTLMPRSQGAFVLAYLIFSTRTWTAPFSSYSLTNNRHKWLLSGVTTNLCMTPSSIASKFRNSVDLSWKINLETWDWHFYKVISGIYKVNITFYVFHFSCSSDTLLYYVCDEFQSFRFTIPCCVHIQLHWWIHVRRG